MSKKRALKAISLLWVGSVLGAGCAFLTQVLLARELGPKSFGLFASTFALVALVSPLATFGISGFWLKAFGSEGWSASRWLSGSLKYTALATSFVLLCLLVWAVMGPHDENTGVLLSVLSFHVLGQVAVELVSAKFQLEERYSALAVWQFLPHFSRLVCVILIFLFVGNWVPIHFIGALYAVIAVFIFIIAFLPIWRMHSGPFSLKGHGNEKKTSKLYKPSITEIFSEAWPFGVASIFYLIYFQSDIVILKYIKGDEIAGIYNVIFLVMSAAYIFPSVVYQKFLLPKIHRWANSDSPIFYEVYRLGNLIMLALGLITAASIWLLSPWGVPFLFGEGYSAATVPLSIIAISAPFRFLSISVGSVLVTKENMRLKVNYMGLAALLNIVLNLTLIPHYGLLGAVVSTIASEVFLLCLYFRGAKLIFSKK